MKLGPLCLLSFLALSRGLELNRHRRSATFYLPDLLGERRDYQYSGPDLLGESRDYQYSGPDLLGKSRDYQYSGPDLLGESRDYQYNGYKSASLRHLEDLHLHN